LNNKLFKIVHFALLLPFMILGFILSFMVIGVLSGWSVYVNFVAKVNRSKVKNESLPSKN
jgi:uncharacterized membrane protein